MYYPRFTKVIIHYFLTQDKTLSWRNKIGMHTSKDDYLINTLRFVSTKEETQIYGAILPESLTSHEMKETKAYKTYLVSTEEPTGKSKRVKRPAKKSTKAPARGVVIRETPEMPLSKKKEKKSMRDFHKTHPSGSGTVTKTAPSAAKIKPSVTSEGTGVKPGVPDVTEEESSENNENESNSEHEIDENESGSESDQDENKEDEDDKEEVKDEHVKTPSNNSDDEDETKFTDKAEGDEDEEMDYTTSQLYDDVDIQLNEPVDSDKGFVQEEGTDAAMTNTEVPVTSSSHSFDLVAKFLNFSDIPHIDVEIVSLMYVYVHYEVPSQQTPIFLIVPVSVISDSSPVFSTVIPKLLPSFTPPPQQSTSTPPPTTEATNPLSTQPDFASVFQFNNRVTTLQKEVVELKKDPLHTQLTALVDDHLDARLGATREEFINFLSATLTARIIEQMVKESLEDVVLAKESSQPQSSYKAAATLTEFKLKKILIDKMDKSESYLAAPEYIKCYEGLKKSYDLYKTIFFTYGDKSQLKYSQKSVQSEEPEFEVADSDMPQDQEENLGKDDEEPKEKVASKRDWFTKPTQPQEPTDPD
ncbi:hypothetical protein Tco_1028340 [Tanacetum coccineum]|uniref:Uncharacterized protein n=1 Tax=Tanacetum coccineum TaxID=301880 RepID=A0ABQ5G0D7_9ASTR